MGRLYIVATPIGNLKDITLRALEALKEVDFILCEDTRVTQKLLGHYEIQKPLISYHQHSRLQKSEQILALLEQGKNLALVSDAGTPGISDPGNKLISLAMQQCSNVTVVPVPGVSAVAAAASISGFAVDRFVFLGYPPAKKKRNKFFEEVVSSKYPVIFYESPYRIIKTLKELQSVVVSRKLLVNIVVCRELTKKFETVHRGTIDQVLNSLEKDSIKGEFTFVVSKKRPSEGGVSL